MNHEISIYSSRDHKQTKLLLLLGKNDKTL